MADKVKIIFFGTPEFAAPALNALLKADFCDVVKIITQPDKPIGRHHSKLIPSPIKKVAQEAGISVAHEFTKTGAKLGVLVAYGDIIPKKIIDSFPMGILNLHPSLLPKYRGSSPIQAAILNQDKETGVTIMKLDDKMDHGPIVAQKKIKLNQTETSGELHDKLAQVGADLLIKILPDYIAKKIEAKKQDHNKASYTEKLTKKDGKIDWSQAPEKIDAQIRAMNPWSGAWTEWNNKKLIIWKASLNDNVGARHALHLPLQLDEVQLQGKKKMAFEEFFKGHPRFSIDQFMNQG